MTDFSDTSDSDLENNKPTQDAELYPIFPISNAVFFPKTILPLHIFEPRLSLKDILTMVRLLKLG